MQLSDLWATLLRRWYLVLVAIVLTAGATIGAAYLVGATYKAEAAMLVVPPGTTVDQQSNSSGTLGNPFLALGGLTQARDIVIQSLSSQQTAEELCAADGDAAYLAMRAELCKSRPSVKYEITPDFTSSAPVILITVEADDPANTVVLLNALAAKVPTTLTDLQSEFSLRPKARIGALAIVLDNVPVVVRKSQLRAAIVAGGGVMALSLLAIALIDGLAGPRRPRHRGSDQADGDAERDVDGSDPASIAEQDEVAADEVDATDDGWGWTESEATEGWGSADPQQDAAPTDPSDEPNEDPAAESKPVKAQ